MQISLNTRATTYDLPDEITSYNDNTYEIGEQIGQGGNAVVCDGISIDGEIYAIKFLLHTNEKSRIRFKQEIELIKQINHPHIIKYVDSGEMKAINHNGRESTIPYIVMEKADSNLVEFIRKTAKIGYEIYAPQFTGLSEALDLLHKHAIHRDIKPENILIKGETWLLSDFGLCCYLNNDERIDITGENEKIGPKYWLSPEAINRQYFIKEDIREYSDVFQLCAVFWFTVTQRHPTGILMKSDWPNTDGKIFGVLSSALSHDKQKRPQNGNELYKLMLEATLT